LPFAVNAGPSSRAFCCWLVAAVIVILPVGKSAAQDGPGDYSYRKQLYGHQISIVGPDDDELVIDGKTVLTGLSIGIDGEHSINGVGVLIGRSFKYAETCSYSIFVVSLPNNGPARLHGPKWDCGSNVIYTVEKDAIRFVRSIDYKPKTWVWTPDKGMSAEVSAATLQAQRTMGPDLWHDLRDQRFDRPVEFFSHPNMRETIKKLIGKDEDRVARAAFGAGKIEREGALFVATSCAPYACGTEELLFVFDTTNKGIYAAWKLDDEKPYIVRPAADKWSSLARSELDKWTKRWDSSEATRTDVPISAETSALQSTLFEQLRTKRLSKSEDVFSHPGMVIPIETLLGGNRETVMSIVRGGQGTLDYKGDIVVGTLCQPKECAEKSLLFAVDVAKKQVFFAWRVPGQPITMKPPIEGWSQLAKAELATWSKRWTASSQNGGSKP
jgi:hypothetical protein